LKFFLKKEGKKKIPGVPSQFPIPGQPYSKRIITIRIRLDKCMYVYYNKQRNKERNKESIRIVAHHCHCQRSFEVRENNNKWKLKNTKYEIQNLQQILNNKY